MNFGVINYLDKNQYDVIIVGGYSTPTGMLAINYMKLKNIPFILNADGGLIPSKENIIKSKIKRYFISSANYWLSTGKSTNEYLKHYGANEENIFIYPFTTMAKKDIISKSLTVDEKRYYKNKLNIQEDKMVLTVGRFIYSKGFDVLLNACKDLPKHYGVYLVGGESTEEYLKLKEDLDLTNVHFIGFKSKEKLKEYYKASDLFVLPTREDVWGLVINEAMSFGLPIISTDKCVAGVELVQDYDNGFIVPVNNVDLLAEKINEILSNEKLVSKMGNFSLDKSSRYTIENMAIEHLEIFKKVLEIESVNENL